MRKTHGPRLSDDPRYAAMRAGQAVHPDAAEFGLVTLYRFRSYVPVGELPPNLSPDNFEVATVG